MGVFIFFVISYILLCASLYKVFEKAGKPGWQALIPFYHFLPWCDIIGRPKWWAALLLIPIVNVFIFAGMIIDLIRCFDKHGFWDWVLAVVYAPAYFFYLSFTDKETFIGPIVTLEKEYQAKLAAAEQAGDEREFKKLVYNNPYKKSQIREWAEAIIFAVFAAALIRMFLIEAYVIPTSSMESSLMVGDFLFVSKAHYGIRMPMTLVQFPLVHNTLPVVGSESYLKSPSLNYKRLPALESIDRFEPVVFNYPAGDSVYVTPARNFSIQDVRRDPRVKAFVNGRKLRVRPIDKRDHYIKRCVGLPGDNLEIRDRQLFIDGKEAQNPENIQFRYIVKTNGTAINTDRLDEFGVSLDEIAQNTNPNGGIYHLTNKQVEQIRGLGNDVTVEHYDFPAAPTYTFPQDPKNFPNQSVDNFGPIWIPAAGESVVLTDKNISVYRRVIESHEGNKVEVKNGRIFINGEQTTSYTFQQNYYWMMGDNRHNSEDSRVWGFVPEDHIVGKPLFIWFSTKNGNILNGIRWNRIFTSANKM